MQGYNRKESALLYFCFSYFGGFSYFLCWFSNRGCGGAEPLHKKNIHIYKNQTHRNRTQLNYYSKFRLTLLTIAKVIWANNSVSQFRLRNEFSVYSRKPLQSSISSFLVFSLIIIRKGKKLLLFWVTCITVIATDNKTVTPHLFIYS